VSENRKIVSLIAACVLACSLVVSQAACPNGPGPVGPVINAVVDCLGSNRPQIDKLLGEFRPIISAGSVSWPDVKLRATQAGKDIGGCFIMELTQWFLSGTRAAPDALAAREAADSFRKDVAGGATYSTICVREDGTKSACKL
jgi:hypothetical protein